MSCPILSSILLDIFYQIKDDCFFSPELNSYPSCHIACVFLFQILGEATLWKITGGNEGQEVMKFQLPHQE